MKNNTEKVKSLLQQALQAVPSDFALTEVRSFIRAALQRVEAVETKRERREAQFTPPAVSSAHTKATIQFIDEMIGLEKEKIKGINQRKTNNDGFEDIQAILG